MPIDLNKALSQANLKKQISSDLKFLQHAVVKDKKRAKVWYSDGELINHPKGTITIYAKDYGQQLPKELFPKNETDFQTDYFDTDTARITPQNKYYKKVLDALKKQEATREKLLKKRKEKYGWA
jgi:hypothetical protein